MRWLGTLAAILLAAGAGVAKAPDPDAGIAAVEKRIGGRIGVALLGADGTLRRGHRADERFAMCSTFKLALAALVLEQADRGRLSLDEPLAFGRPDLVTYSPVVSANLGKGRLPIAVLAEAIVTVSDNAAANLLLARIGGPEALTAFARRHGDTVTRLDRTEPELNENLTGDPRDTTSPAAMARLARTLLLGDALSPASRQRLIGWTQASRTGLQRIRGGLPEGWRAGDKTGSCGTAYNDVAIVWPPDEPPFLLTVYVDRPTVDGEAANAAIADIGRIAATAAARKPR